MSLPLPGHVSRSDGTLDHLSVKFRDLADPQQVCSVTVRTDGWQRGCQARVVNCMAQEASMIRVQFRRMVMMTAVAGLVLGAYAAGRAEGAGAARCDECSTGHW